MALKGPLRPAYLALLASGILLIAGGAAVVAARHRVDRIILWPVILGAVMAGNAVKRLRFPADHAIAVIEPDGERPGYALQFGYSRPGYRTRDVERLLVPVERAIVTADVPAHAAALAHARATPLPLAGRGYDRARVDDYIARADEPRPAPTLEVADMDVPFQHVLRGYDAVAVQALFAQVESALAGGDPADRAAALAAVGATRFTVVLRGYDRNQVDHYLRQATRELGG
ncbi:DivIVA domain-containing protein [Dactylosporangium sp. CA-139066]|uniref:DivIVA domain-containing protein n=1 Tax=Dactylosporangium sp. CA-139066 TaxID=3239930 RepID=UPI003D8D5D17